MLETHLKSPVTRRRLCASPAADHLDAFAEWLRLQGYTPVTVEGLLRSLAGWTDWMIAAALTAQDFLQAFDACGLAVRKERRVHYSRGPNRRSIAAAAVFIRFLQQSGKLPLPVPPPSASDRWPVLAEFRSWMRDHRGLRETTLDLYEGILPGLLDSIGDDAKAYSPEALRAFVQERARPHGIHRARCIVVAVRAFVRFLGATGQCPPGMEYAIPGFADWQLSSVPRFLAAEDVERGIQSQIGRAHV